MNFIDQKIKSLTWSDFEHQIEGNFKFKHEYFYKNENEKILYVFVLTNIQYHKINKYS